jgi:hypothetical protein
MSSSFIAYLVIGKVFIFLGEKFARGNDLKGFMGRLLTCGLCSGTWCYTILSLLMGEVLFRDLFYVPLVSELATGGLISILVHLIHRGWKSEYEVIEIP